MSRLISVILLAILMIPAAGVVYVVTAVIWEEFRYSWPYRRMPERMLFVTGGACTWAFIAVYWSLVWRSYVRWTGRRIALTFAAAAAALAAGLFAGFLLNAINGGFGDFIASVLWPILWLIATVFIWRETAAERTERIGQSGRDAVACPSCGYNLTGLTATRCPECGRQYTLDELFASQPSQADAEVLG